MSGGIDYRYVEFISKLYMGTLQHVGRASN